MQLCQLVERQFRLAIRQHVAHNDVLTAKLAPKGIRRPLLRHRSARTFDPNEVPLHHGNDLCTRSAVAPYLLRRNQESDRHVEKGSGRAGKRKTPGSSWFLKRTNKVSLSREISCAPVVNERAIAMEISNFKDMYLAE